MEIPMTQTTDPRTIKVADIGPIRKLLFTLPKDGGVAVARGENGSGKSTLLRSVSAGLRGEGALPLRQGAIGGSLEGLGVKVTVGKRTRRDGEEELAVLQLEDPNDPSVLVDPGIADPAAADRRRIAALLHLGHVTATPAAFHDLFGGEPGFKAVLTEADLQGVADPVELGARIKRSTEKAARAHEEAVERLTGEIDAHDRANAGIDLQQPADEAALAGDREAAIRELARLETLSRERAGALRAAAEAQTRLDGQAQGLSLADADAQVIIRRQALAETDGAIERLNAELARARTQRAEQTKAVQDAEGMLATVKQREAALEGWRASVAAAAGVTPIPDADLQAARHRVEEARQAEQQGATVRAARARAELAAMRRQERDGEQQAGEFLRKAAAGVEAVLSGMVQQAGVAGLQVRDGRLVAIVPERGEVYFAELSDGERWRLALDAAIAAVGPGGLIPVNQQAWEGLSPKNRGAIADHARAARVTVLTAEAAEGELRVEEFEGKSSAA
jgi:energy-coupling factor transporter ATP-binding protein EcfA2